MEFDPFCKYFFSATHVPITCVNNGEIVSIYGLREEISPYRRLSKKLEMIREYWYVEADEYAYYGIVRQPEGQNAFLILGPTFTIDIDVSILEAYMLENDIDFSLREEVYYTLSKLPQLTHYSFLSSFPLRIAVLPLRSYCSAATSIRVQNSQVKYCFFFYRQQAFPRLWVSAKPG